MPPPGPNSPGDSPPAAPKPLREAGSRLCPALRWPPREGAVCPNLTWLPMENSRSAPRGSPPASCPLSTWPPPQRPKLRWPPAASPAAAPPGRLPGSKMAAPAGVRLARGSRDGGVWTVSRRKREGPSREQGLAAGAGWRRRSSRAGGQETRLSPRSPPALTRRRTPLHGLGAPGTKQPRCPRPHRGCRAGRGMQAVAQTGQKTPISPPIPSTQTALKATARRGGLPV